MSTAPTPSAESARSAGADRSSLTKQTTASQPAASSAVSADRSFGVVVTVTPSNTAGCLSRYSSSTPCTLYTWTFMPAGGCSGGTWTQRRSRLAELMVGCGACKLRGGRPLNEHCSCTASNPELCLNTPATSPGAELVDEHVY